MTDDFSLRLSRVGQRLADDWTRLQAEAASPEEARRMVAQVTEAVQRAVSDGGRGSVDLAPSPLGRRIAALIRRDYLQLVGRHPTDAAELLRVLRAIEAVSQALEPQWDSRFADRLSGPEALDLVVEVAHDLRSPLTSILFLAETLMRARSGPVTPLQERQLGLIYSAAFGLSSVASDVIELVRGGERILGSDPVPFSVAEVMESVRDIVLPIVEEKGLRIEIRAGDLGTRVGQPVGLSRILLNLTTNALKFTEHGQVELAAEPVGADQVQISVADTGRGIPAAALAMLFEPFRRRNNPGEYAFSGSGLGLSICRKLVEAMGGELAVQTDAGQGTRFSFVVHLPAYAAAPNTTSIAESR